MLEFAVLDYAFDSHFDLANWAIPHFDINVMFTTTSVSGAAAIVYYLNIIIIVFTRIFCIKIIIAA
jgi:hypothetical protein